MEHFALGLATLPFSFQSVSAMVTIAYTSCDSMMRRNGVIHPSSNCRTSYGEICVFRSTAEGYRNRGPLNAHPTFTVQPDASGIPTIKYGHRVGADDIQVKRIQYVRNRFIEVDRARP